MISNQTIQDNTNNTFDSEIYQYNLPMVNRTLMSPFDSCATDFSNMHQFETYFMPAMLVYPDFGCVMPLNQMVQQMTT